VFDGQKEQQQQRGEAGEERKSFFFNRHARKGAWRVRGRKTSFWTRRRPLFGVGMTDGKCGMPTTSRHLVSSSFFFILSVTHD